MSKRTPDQGQRRIQRRAMVWPKLAELEQTMTRCTCSEQATLTQDASRGICVLFLVSNKLTAVQHQAMGAFDDYCRPHLNSYRLHTDSSISESRGNMLIDHHDALHLLHRGCSAHRGPSPSCRQLAAGEQYCQAQKLPHQSRNPLRMTILQPRMPSSPASLRPTTQQTRITWCAKRLPVRRLLSACPAWGSSQGRLVPGRT